MSNAKLKKIFLTYRSELPCSKKKFKSLSWQNRESIRSRISWTNARWVTTVFSISRSVRRLEPVRCYLHS